MEPFATPTELATYLRTATQDEATAGSPDVLDTGVALQALELASGDIRAVCGWSISRETVTEPLAAWSFGKVFLPTLHLVSVTITADATTLTVNTDYTFTANGTITPLRNRYVATLAEITYTHGYEPVPSAIKSVVLERAARIYSNPQQLVSATVGGVTDVFSRASAPSQDLASDPRVQAYMLPTVG
jgi:hypothetical protein